jgi:sucrose-phosphate phosphatase subfamily
VPTYLLNLAKELIMKGNEVVEVHLRVAGEEHHDEVKGIRVNRVPREPIKKDIMVSYSKFKETVYKESHYNVKEFRKSPEETEGYREYFTVNEYFGEELKELLEENPPEIVHIHDFQLLFAYKYVPRGIPCILTWHIPFIDNMSTYLKKFLIKHLNEYDKVVFSSQEYIDAALKAGLDPGKPKLIHPIANTNIFKKMDVDAGKEKAKYGIPSDSRVILCVQRVDPKSGHEHLIQALPMVLKKFPDAKLVFVGGESMSNKLSKSRAALKENVLKLIKKLGVEKSVIWTGTIDYFDLPKLYNAADVDALCSKNEGFGLAVTEGMACGLPVVGTKVGGIPIQVKDGYNGFLADVGDYKATANSIIKLLSDDKLRERMGENSLKRVEKEFHIDRGVEKHLIMYNEVMKSKEELFGLRYMNKNEIKGIITDLDRTIIDEPAKREFDPLDFDTDILHKMKDLGIDLFLSTGRNVRFVKKLCKHFKIWRCVISENGAVLYFPATKKTLTVNTYYMKRAKRIIREMNLPDVTIGKVIASIRVEDEQKVRDKLGKIAEHVKFIRNVDEILVLPNGVDKGMGVRLAMRYLNIDLDHTIVVGDGENDIDMFLNPGFKIALSNADKKLKEVANQVMTKPATKGMKEIIDMINM